MFDGIWFDVFSNCWQKIDAVLDLVNFCHVHWSFVQLVFNWVKVLLSKNFSIIFSKSEQRAIVWSNVSFWISVSRWPLIVIIFECENITGEQIMQDDTLLEKNWQILLEQVA